MKKKIIVFSFFILTVFLLASCARDKNTIITDDSEKHFTYPMGEVTSFTVDEKRNLYFTTEDSTSLYCYNENGTLIKEYEIGEVEDMDTNLCIDDNYIYCFSYLEEDVAFKQLDLTSGLVNEFIIAKDTTGLIKMEIINDNIYYIRWSENYDLEQEYVRYDEDDDYYYMGETVAVYNTETKSTKALDIPNVILFSKTDNDNLLFYAYDSIGGYYFTVYDTDQEVFGEKTYNNDIGYVFSFAYDSIDDNIIYSKFHDQRLYVTKREDGSSKAEIMTDIVAMTGNDILYQDGYTYILNNANKMVTRVDNDKSMKNNMPLKIYQPSFYAEFPPGCGYNISSDTLSEENFALTILAGDSNFDLCLMSSDHVFSRSIRDKQPFHPLNDIPEVIDYLDLCFPYLKDAATSEDGDIWMIPITVDANCIVYHEENCKEEGIKIEDINSIDELIQLAKDLKHNPDTLDRYGFPSWHVDSYAIAQYVDFYGIKDNKAYFDTPLFRDLCRHLSKIRSAEAEDISSSIYQPVDVGFENYYDNFLFELLIYKFSMRDEDAYDLLRARPLPPIESNGKIANSINCVYLCVNPNSDNLENALNYIADLCGTMSTQFDTFILNDIDYYSYNESPLTQDLFDIYSNGNLSFNLSKEIFWNDYLDYHKGVINLDSLIMELERKINAYLNE